MWNDIMNDFAIHFSLSGSFCIFTICDFSILKNVSWKQIEKGEV